MSKKYTNVQVTYETCYFDIEIDDEEIEFAKRCGIDIEDDDELVKFHLDNDFAEHQDLLNMEDYEYEEVEEEMDEEDKQ